MHYHHVSKEGAQGFETILLWSCSALFVSKVVDMSPFLLAGLSMFLYFCMFFIRCLLLKENFISYFKIKKEQALLVILMFLSSCSYYVAFKMAPAFMVNVVNYTWPIFLILFISIKNRKIKYQEIMGVLFGFIGVLFLILNNLNGSIDSNNCILGCIIMLIGSISWATYSTLTKEIRLDSDTIGAMFLPMSLMFFVIYILFGNATFHIESRNYIWILLNSLTYLPYIFWDKSMKMGNGKIWASLSYFIPLFSIIILYLFHDVVLSIYVLISAALIISGGVISNMDKILHRT